MTWKFVVIVQVGDRKMRVRAAGRIGAREVLRAMFRALHLAHLAQWIAALLA